MSLLSSPPTTGFRRFLDRIGLWQLLDSSGLRKQLRRARQIVSPSCRRERLALDRDYREFCERFHFLKQQANTPVEKKVLVISLCDWIPQAKIESILAKSLELRGCKPVIATLRSMENAHKYHRAFGFQDFLFLEDFTKPQDDEIARQVTREVLDKKLTFKDLLDLEYHGVQIGRHVLSSIVSQLRRGTVGLNDPQALEMLQRMLPEAVACALAAERLVEHVNPDVGLLLERGYVPFGELFDAVLNRGVPVIQYCHSHRKDALILKRYTAETRGAHPWSLGKQSWEAVKAMPWSAENEQDLIHEIKGRYEEGTWFNRKYLQVGKTIKSSEDVRDQLQLDPSKKTAIIFSHVLWDATFFYGTNLFEDYEHWLVETVKSAINNPSVNWVVKLHPDYVWKMKKAGDTGRPPEYTALESKVGPLPPHIKILSPSTDISTYSLFDLTDWCITVRGTIGIEMSCFGVPVITAGTGRYSGLGITIESESRDDYLEKLRSIQNIPPMTSKQTELARRQAYAAFRMKPIPFHSFEMVQDNFESLGHALDHNVVVRANSLDAFRNSDDLMAFAKWASESNLEDFLLSDKMGREECLSDQVFAKEGGNKFQAA